MKNTMRSPHPFHPWRRAASMLFVLLLPLAACGAPPGPPAHLAGITVTAPTAEPLTPLPDASANTPTEPWASPLCPPGAASRDRAVITVTGEVARFAPSTFTLPDDSAPQRVEWQEDLNGDGLVDLAVFHDACSSYGECMYGVYAQCEGGVFIPVFEADYLLTPPTPTAHRDEGWRRLWSHARVHDPGSFTDRVEPLELRFEEGRYVVR